MLRRPDFQACFNTVVLLAISILVLVDIATRHMYGGWSSFMCVLFSGSVFFFVFHESFGARLRLRSLVRLSLRTKPFSDDDGFACACNI